MNMIFAFLSNLFGFGKAAAEEVTQHEALENSDAMKANAAAQTEAKISAEISSAETKAAAGDLSEAQRLAGS